jgi:prefoldin subunit 5
MSLKNEIIAMAQAHMKNVVDAIVDLEKKRDSISQEINKLQDYLKLGTNSIEQFSQEDV